jgi:hypothetical protein
MTIFSRLAIASFLVGTIVACGGGNRAVAQPERRQERRDDRQDRRTEALTGWEKLGERWVDGKVDRDAIDVGAREGRFRRVMLKVEHSAMELYDIRFVFGDGSDFSPNTRIAFDKDSRTRTIDLPGGARIIRRVEFRTGNLPGGGRAQLEVWAQ